MCGIAGFISKQPVNDGDVAAVQKMSRLLLHRGPDDTGFFRADQIILAMRRLSIIDLESGRQPIYNEDKTVVLVFNGEIYNYKELRKELIAKGHRLKTDSDSETIVHLYEEYGIDCLSHLRGMFAIVLYDRKKKAVFIARDRIGEKPLYLYGNNKGLYFASEIKALIQSGIAAKEIDYKALHYYFHYRYIPEPMTPLAGIKKLQPGHTVWIDLHSWEMNSSCYWNLEDLPPIEGNPVQLFRETLEDVSGLIAQADVPVGIALSGGLDSSALACLLASQGVQVQAISLGYEESHYSDEREDARALARHLKIPFIGVEVNSDEMVELFPEIIYMRDDPISDISGYSYYTIMKTARENNIKVMIQGQGGDELFLSYDWVNRALNNSTLKSRDLDQQNVLDYFKLYLPETWTLRTFKEWMLDLGGLWPSIENYKSIKNTPADQLEFYNLEKMYRHNLKYGNAMYTDWFSGQINKINVNDCFTYARPWGDVGVLIMASLFKTYLLQNGIAQGDRLSMANSVEMRLPFVDSKLVELMVGLRKAGVGFGSSYKELMKTALSDLIPEFVLHRPKKGFSPPVRLWEKNIYDKYNHLLSDGFLVNHSIIKPEYIQNHFSRKLSLQKTERNNFMKLLVLELWFREMLG